LQTRLKRHLVAAAVIGSLVAGGAVYGTPALADPADTTTTEPTATATTTAPADETTGPTADPTTTAPDQGSTTATAEPTATETTGTTTTTTTPATTSPTPDPTTTGPAPDTTAPTGSFKLSLATMWVGQKTTLTVTAADDVSAFAAITKVITWGDGTSSTVPVAATTITKQYPKAGTFTIGVTLTDEAGNKATLNSVTAKVTVPGTFKLSKSSVWHHEAFNVAISSVPAGTTKIVLYFGDGYAKTLSGKNQTVAKSYYYRSNNTLVPAGAVTLTAVFTNNYGSTSQIYVGKITIKKDSWSPKVTITKPKKSSSAAAWKTVKGTATDKGSGISDMIAVVMRTIGTKTYCYSYRNTWIKLNSSTNVLNCFHEVKVKSGKWSLTVKGQKKGSTLDIFAVAGDWSDRTGQAEVVKKLTKA
jgi:hypothetical protein